MIRRRRLALGAAAGLTAVSGRRARAQGAAAPRFATSDIVVAMPTLPQFRAHQRRLEAFTARSGVRVRMQFLSPEQLRERVASEFAAGPDPDVVYVGDGWMAQLADKLVPLDDRLARDSVDLARYPAVFRGACAFNGAMRGLPVRGFTQLLFYRQDLFRRERLPPPATWEDALTAALKVQREQNIGGMAMYYGRSPNAAGVALWLNFLWGRGGDLFDPKWMPRFSDAAGQQATQVYLDIMLRYEIAVSGAVKFREADAVAAMAQGRAAVLPGWGWHVAALATDKTRLKPDQIGIAAMPGYRGRAPAPCATVGLLSIVARSSNQDAAWEYLKWAASAELEMAIAGDRTSAEPREDVLVHNASLAAAAQRRDSNGYHAATAATLAHARLLPQLTQWPQVAEILDGMLAEAAVGQRLLRSTLEDAARQIEQLLRRDGVIKS
jgi:multiple sugar transport system substrate-binding protein